MRRDGVAGDESDRVGNDSSNSPATCVVTRDGDGPGPGEVGGQVRIVEQDLGVLEEYGGLNQVVGGIGGEQVFPDQLRQRQAVSVGVSEGGSASNSDRAIGSRAELVFVRLRSTARNTNAPISITNFS